MIKETGILSSLVYWMGCRLCFQILLFRLQELRSVAYLYAISEIILYNDVDMNMKFPADQKVRVKIITFYSMVNMNCTVAIGAGEDNNEKSK